MFKTRVGFLFAFLSIFVSCKEDHQSSKTINKKPSTRVIIIQPFSDFSPALSANVFTQLKAINENTILRTAIPLPAQSYYPSRNRYRADTIIRYLSYFGSIDSVVIGLTYEDISTTKGKFADFGVMGLGYCPGKACVVSTYRLTKTYLAEQFYKVAIHELGHTQGLPHCPDKTCFMRDAEGGNPLNDEKDFCESCRNFLKEKGWNLQ